MSPASAASLIAPPAPRRLRHDNVTPASRTPWGGTRIARAYKAALTLPPDVERIGESWEVSVEPSFPSRTADDDVLLAGVIASAPVAWLGPRVAARFEAQCPLLVKLLDAADNLSVQVHPSDSDPALAADESGKPESWVVLEAQPGAGLYLGFREGVGRRDVEHCIADGGALDALMTFVEVQPGDAFVIAAGTAHAIGAGVTLVEPQLVRPGRRGLTYRFWDWNRRYTDGKRDPAGAPRQLHLQRSLQVTHWDGPRGEAFIESCRGHARGLDGGGLQREQLVDWQWFDVERWRGSGQMRLDAVDPENAGLLALVCVAGQLRIAGAGGELHLACGQSGVIAAASCSTAALVVDAEEADVVVTRARG